ncbi:MAG: DUF4326 domain-containing protein [Paracoccaceae bacterium]
MPKRIQMTRKKGGWRKDNPDAVIVARPSKWGNRFVVGERYLTAKMGHAIVRDRAHAVELFRKSRDARRWDMAELRGKDLACWCPLDEPCHADVLLDVANRPLASVPTKDTPEKGTTHDD